MEKVNKLRTKTIEFAGEYAKEVFEKKTDFIPGKTHVPVSGKLIGKEEIINAVDACLDGWFTSGRYVKQFEKEFSKFMNQRFCLLTNSGSSANLLAISALTSEKLGQNRLKAGDEVITVATGFPTTTNPIIQNNLTPVFVDANLEDYSIDVKKLEKAMSSKVKAIMLAHTLGNPFNLDLVTKFTKKYNLWLIEDCCDAIGSTYNGEMVGTFGHIATASFYPAHHITMGEGGAVLTNNPKLKKIIESFRDWGRDCWCEPGVDNTCGKRFEWKIGELPHGFDHKYIYSHVGYNLKLTDMQAAIGLAQLKKIDYFINKRKENYEFLYDALSPLKKYIRLPSKTINSEPSWFGFPIYVKNNSPMSRNDIVKKLDKSNIGTRLLFGGNLLKQPLYNGVKYRKSGKMNNSDKIMNNVFWVGTQPSLTIEMRQFIVDELFQIFDQ